MKRRQALCALLACLMLLSCTVKTSAAEVRPDLVAPCATGQLNFDVKANSEMLSSGSFTMAKGEKVTFKVTYLPASAVVDCGVVDENGNFQYLHSDSGSISGSITIKTSGSYQLMVRNNSAFKVTIGGTVNY